MKPKQVRVFAPATIGNVGPGFDVLGLALAQPGDIVVATRTNESGLQFSLDESIYPTPSDQQNVAAHVAQLMLDEFKPPFGITLTLQKNMPLGSGLGSSGASCAAAAFAVNQLLPTPLDKMDLVRFAMEGERLATGSAHADNVAPALLGGVCLIRSYAPLEVVQIPTKNRLYWVVVHPHLVLRTQTARACLPTSIPLKLAVQQWGDLAGLITALITGDTDLLAASLNDQVAEPVRATLIPGFYAAKDAALRSGAIGFSISGSGPSVFAVAISKESAAVIANSIMHVFKEVANIDSDSYISRINQEGANIMDDCL